MTAAIAVQGAEHAAALEFGQKMESQVQLVFSVLASRSFARIGIR